MITGAEPTGSSVSFSAEFATDTDGAIHLFISGERTTPSSATVAAYTELDPSTGWSQPQRAPDPFASSPDPGSPAHLGVTPTTAQPWLMYVEEDGLHVYLPVGP